MPSHPFLQSVFHLLISIVLMILTCLSAVFLLVYYQQYSLGKAVIEGGILTFIWSVTLYYSWYISLYVQIGVAKLVVGVCLQGIILFLLYVLSVSSGLSTEEMFIQRMPFLFLFGGLVWIVGMQWFTTQKKEDREEVPAETISLQEEPNEPKVEPVHTLSVKSGSRIHIIPVEEVYHIQACGDYVNIFSVEGQFIKEQTMKSLEASLPLSFIRIHRSSIINSEQLLRIELFGKDNYHVYLKNGETLKASLSGYRLLKQRLNL